MSVPKPNIADIERGITRKPSDRQSSPRFGDYASQRQQQPEEETADVAKRVAVMKANGVLQAPPNARVIE